MTFENATKIGLISDVQYANVPNGVSLHTGVPRFYSCGMRRFSNAVKDFKQQNVHCVVQLGDLIDLQCAKDSLKCLERFSGIMERSGLEWINVIGNHELSNLSRNQVSNILHPGKANYYTMDFPHGYRLIILDTYDISVLGHPQESSNFQIASRILDEHNPNVNKNRNDNIPDRRYVAYNGMVGDEQLRWLDDVLGVADGNKQVIIASHIPLRIDPTRYQSIPWNCEAINDVILKHSCVKLVISGHRHEFQFGPLAVKPEKYGKLRTEENLGMKVSLSKEHLWMGETSNSTEDVLVKNKSQTTENSRTNSQTPENAQTNSQTTDNLRASSQATDVSQTSSHTVKTTQQTTTATKHNTNQNTPQTNINEIYQLNNLPTKSQTIDNSQTTDNSQTNKNTNQNIQENTNIKEIYQLTLPAVVEAAEGREAHAILTLEEGAITISGDLVGNIQIRV